MSKSFIIKSNRVFKNVTTSVFPNAINKNINTLNEALFTETGKIGQMNLISNSLVLQQQLNATKNVPISENFFPEPISDFSEKNLIEILLKDDDDGREIPTCKPTPSCRVKKPKKKDHKDRVPKKDPCKKDKPCGKGIKNTCQFENDPKWDK